MSATDPSVSYPVQILSIARHRNGTSGLPFHAVLFTFGEHMLLATLFDERGACAVLEVDKAAGGNVAHDTNGWRGDVFEPLLRHAISTGRKTALT